ncbi:uncharacterized protein si:ch211-1a19.3 [Hippoglossus hippoglossus]|uniref:uncharacterized protein si:ch211-1a19.3 n=1 Tax=Hippoglossus hippoglossus TaxID=8267 RepID=UPI00148E5743|nr:uncharacterized protein si:ch211-1a19.3 [Hippoglossus hippoglossus]
MAAPSKSSQKAKNVAIALLALWSIVSLVVIVVWATSPDLKSSAQCRVELQDTREKLEGAKVVWGKDRVALEEKVEEEREQQARLTADNRLLLGRLDATNASLEECRQENVVLNRNISLLQDEVEQLLQTETNLTTQLGLKEDHIDALQQNLTQTSHQTESCFSLKDAAQSQMVAAQIQTKACESNQQYLQKQLHKCKAGDSQPPQQTTPEENQASSDKKSAAPPLAGIPALTLLLYFALHLIT